MRKTFQNGIKCNKIKNSIVVFSLKIIEGGADDDESNQT
jgi:hypothetical protein